MLTKEYLPTINTRKIILTNSKDGGLNVKAEVSADFEDLASTLVFSENNFYLNSFLLKLVPAHTEEFLFNDGDNNIDGKPLSAFNIRRFNQNEARMELDFHVEEQEPSFLGYKLFLGYNEAFLKDKFDTQEGSKFFDKQLVLAREKVFQDGEIFNKGFVFFDDEGEVWRGDIEKREGKYFKEGTNQKLRKETVTSPKIKDYRSLTSDGSQRKFKNSFKFKRKDLSEFKSSFERELQREISNKFSPKKNQEYFSRICLSKRIGGKVSGIFGINWHEMIRDLSEFRGLAQGNQQRFQAIKSLTSIDEIVLHRVRVELNDSKNRLGNKIEDVREVADSLRKREVVAKLSQSDEEGFVNVVGDLEERFIKGSEKSARFFDFADVDFKNITDGKYAYKVEIVVSDGTRQFLESLLGRMKNIFNYLKNYQQDRIRFSNDQTEEFYQFVRDTFSSKKFENPEDVISKELLKIFQLLLDREEAGNLLNIEELEKYLHPKTATIESIQRVVEYVKSARQVMRDVLGEDQVTNTSLQNSEVKQNVAGSPRAKKISLTNMFGDTMDADKKPSLGMFRHWDYNEDLYREPNYDDRGMLPVFPNVLDSRKRSEQLRFFSDPDVDVSLGDEPEKKASSIPLFDFSPTSLNAENKSVDFALFEESDSSELSKVENSIGNKFTPLSFGAPFMQPLSSLSLPKLGNFGSSYEEDFNQDFLQETELKCAKNNLESVPNSLKTSVDEQNKSGTGMDIGDLTEPSNLKPAGKNLFSDRNIESTPIQIRALSLAAQKKTSSLKQNPAQEAYREGNFSSEVLPVLRNGYSNVMRIEKFDGFERDESGRELIKKGKWSFLREEDKASANSPILCRFKKVAQNPAKFLTDKVYERRDVADKYFVLDVGEEQPQPAFTASLDADLPDIGDNYDPADVKTALPL